MTAFQLNPEVRTKTGKGDSRRLRMAGKVPAVIYGKGVDPIHCSLPIRDLEKAVRTMPRNTILTLVFEGGKEENREVIIRDYQKNPISHLYTHIDFQAIDRNVPLNVEVEVDFVGIPAGKKAGAILTTQNKTVRIQCLPGQIPQAIELDVTSMNAGESRHVSDLPDEGFKILTNPKITLCQMSLVKEEAATVGAVEGAAEGAEGAAAPAAAEKSAGKA